MLSSSEGPLCRTACLCPVINTNVTTVCTHIH